MMENTRLNLEELLEHINPALLSYSEWTQVGQALKLEGYPCRVWDAWSRQDYGRYHENECEKKWRSFKRDEGVTGGTIFHLAVLQGWSPKHEGGGRILSMDDAISYELPDTPIVGEGWAEHREINAPSEKSWDPIGELTRYLEALFKPDEIFGYVVSSYEKPSKEGHAKWVPANSGIYTRKAGDVLKQLRQAQKEGASLETVIGKYEHAAGAWIHFNPLDGNGVHNENVTDFRYALVESDSMDVEAQNGLIRQLNLPVAVLVHSGGKSLHAIIKIDAPNFKEYRERVDYLYDICHKNGMEIDIQNKNQSRLSRMPGCIRGESRQFIVDTDIGCKSWEEWKEWIEAADDSLPGVQSLAEKWNDMPELAPELIKGVLRAGHKMLIAGPSKAGKSFDLIELIIAIAEGGKWHGFQCRKGTALYVNLELDERSCFHRFRCVYDALGISPANISSIDIWNLRGQAEPLDKLAPKLIRRAKDRHYSAIVVDPIYKVITGDENSADQMAKFCNQFDKICTSLDAAVIYCHHHSKGAQGGKKAVDRASGSGVFTRDPDAILDMVELELTDDIINQEINKATCKTCRQYLEAFVKDRNWQEELSQDDMLSSQKVLAYCSNILDEWQRKALERQVEAAVSAVKSMTAWRIEGTLREFPRFPPVNCWFKYPIHVAEESGALEDVKPDTGMKKNSRGGSGNGRSGKGRKSGMAKLPEAFGALEKDGKVRMIDMAKYLNVSKQTVMNYVDMLDGFERDGKGNIVKMEVSKNTEVSKN